MEDAQRTLGFDYIKSNQFRMVHADGAYGGVTPKLGLFLTFYSERAPIPQKVVHRLNNDGGLGDEILEERKIRDAIVREVEVGVLFDLETAKAILGWLQDKISAIENVKSQTNLFQKEHQGQEPKI